MKKLLLLIALLSFCFGSAQISVGAWYTGKLDKFDYQFFKKFKGTTTVFILSNAYDKKDYEEVLKESWTITPYEIVSPTDFDYRNYLSDKYSFAHLHSFCYDGRNSFYLKSLISFYMLNAENIKSKIGDKINDQQSLINLVIDNKINLANILLTPSTEMIVKANSKFGFRSDFTMTTYNRSSSTSFTAYSLKTGNQKLSDYQLQMIDFVYNKNSFRDLTLGALKNYLQQVNQLLTKEQFLWLYDNFKSSDLKRLSSETLYLSNNLKTRYNPNKMRDEEWDSEKLDKIIAEYKFKTQFIDQNELDNKIKNDEDFFYLRKARINSEKFIEIVNGKTGEIVYHNYETGFSEYNIKGNDFENLNKAIEK